MSKIPAIGSKEDAKPFDSIETYLFSAMFVIMFVTLVYVALAVFSVRVEYLKFKKRKEIEEKTPETLTIMDPE
ncbi:unnamed protein product [Bursaphelenchus okinawaensis]|uniref:Uncharacterized protein n=1 Tax=Bursaphelenchus okinawaensis TaxID=465554 RepID=A0A811LF91_9BILA|nr:unnamed protein product [Bursaphelenchus okinawaensis]CAG9122042.1 unnamed protein product [Bursaphelenchus okinawaensis]